MRVIAGSARSLPLKTPQGMDTRPTTDRIKETLFNMLMPHIPSCTFLDLFSGSGAIGIEALSRGAKKAYFMEKDKNALKCIKENLAFTHLEKQAEIFPIDVLHSLYQIREKEIDLIFMDPPYNQELEKKVLEQLQNLSFVTEDTLIIVEASLDTDFSYLTEMGFELMKEKRYKTNKHMFIKRSV